MGERERRRRFIASLSCLLVLAALAVPGAAIAGGQLRGKLDRSFGTGGRAFSTLGPTFARSSFSAMVRQPDGGIVLAGNTEAVKGAYNERTGYVERRGPTGTPDPGFGGGFVQVRAVGGLALQGDGRVLVGVPEQEGTCASSSTVRRLEADGAPDASFGSGGVSATLPFGIRYVAIDAAGGILAAGSANSNPCGHDPSPRYQLALARLLPDGTLDAGFGTGGVVRAGKDENFTGELARGLAIRPNGSILLAGDDALFAFTAAGAPDAGFGKDGVVDVGGAPGALLALPDGRAILAGSSAEYCCSLPSHFVISRYSADGSLDPGFGTGGSVDLAVGGVDTPTALALGPEGGILLGGEVAGSDGCSAGECDFAPLLARFTAAGALDLSFGTSGQTSPELPGRNLGPDYARYAAALAVAPGGQILVAGGSGDAGAATVSARQPNGAPDPAFGMGGAVADSRILPSVSDASGLAISLSGTIFTSAWSDSGAHRPRSILIGSQPDGAPDPGVGDGSGFVVPETDLGLRADGHGRLYSVSTAYRGRGPAYVARFDARGRPDTGYGAGGRAAVPPHFEIESLLVRRNGEALLVGRIARRFGMAAFRLTPSGRPDRRFGGDGLALVGFGPKVKAMALSAAFDSRGRVVLFGNQGPYAGLARLLADGRPDPSFGYGGRQPYLPGLANEESAVAVAPDGDVLVAAAPEAGINPLPTTLIRLRPDGSRDRGFGHNGVVRVDAGAPMISFFAGPRLLLVSGAGNFGEHGVAIRAFRADGRPERHFGRHGLATAATGQDPPFRPAAAARQPNGRLVVAGTAGRIEQSGSRVELLRFR